MRRKPNGSASCLRYAPVPSSMSEALGEARARGWRAKQWTSRSGRTHGGQLLSLSTLRRLLTNVLYCGDIAHKGVAYAGEQEPLVSRELWQEVNDKHKLSRSQIRRHRRVESPLKGLVRCGHCGALQGSQLHEQARRKTSLLRVPGGQEAAAGARGGSCAVVARAPGTE